MLNDRLHSINDEQKMYVLKSGSGFTCLGFDVARDRTRYYLQKMKKPVGTLLYGTKGAYEQFLEAEHQYVNSDVCRTSKQFAELLKVIHGVSPEETLRAVYEAMNKMMAFGSSTAAKLAHQSLEQVLEDDELVLARRRLAAALRRTQHFSEEKK